MGLIMVTGMPLQPHSCVLCGKGPRDENGEIRDNIFAEAIDVNWGDSIYICPECGHIIGGLYDMVTEDEVEELQRKADALDVLQEKHDALNNRVRKILDGGKARKEVVESGTG